VAQAMRRVARTEVPDLPDRIISATALHLGIPIISRDRKIQASDLTTVW
jgi:predicted nucleic acid-binding protein